MAVRPYDSATTYDFGFYDVGQYGEPYDTVTLAEAYSRSGTRSRSLTDRAFILDAESRGYVYLPGSGDMMVTSDSAVNGITGDIDIRVRMAADDWTPSSESAVISKEFGAGTRSWMLTVIPSGFVRLYWSADGTNWLSALSNAAPVVSDGAALWVRATLDVDNGASGRTVTFYTSSDGSSWSQLGTAQTSAGITSIFSGSASVHLGIYPSGGWWLPGRYFRAQVLNGIDGTTVLDIDCDRISSASASTFTAVTGQTVTINKSGAYQSTAVLRMSTVGSRARSLSDSVSSSDTVSRQANLFSKNTELYGANDYGTGTYGTGDLIRLTDAVLRAGSSSRPLYDAASSSDSVLRALSTARGSADSLSSSDAPTGSSSRPRSLSDAVTSSESVSRVSSRSRGPLESLQFAELTTSPGTRPRPFPETITSSASATQRVTGSRALADSAASLDTALRQVSAARPSGGSLSALDSADRALAAVGAVPDSVSATDSQSGQYVPYRFVGWGVPV